MSVELRDRLIQEPKELGEVFDCVEAILGFALNQEGDIQDLIAALALAASGITAVGEEIKHETVYQASGAFAGRCSKIVIEKVVK